MAHFSFRNQFFFQDPEKALKDLDQQPRPERPSPPKSIKQKGVYWYPSVHRWIAEIYVNGKPVRVGEFYKEEPAIEAYRWAETLLKSLPSDVSKAQFRRQFNTTWVRRNRK